MKEPKDMVHQSLLPNSLPPPASQIQQNYRKSKTNQNKYQFPRKKQSLSSSIVSSQFQDAEFYNLHWQNKKQKYQDTNKSLLRIKTKIDKVGELNKTKILQLKKIKEYTQRQSLIKIQKIKVISHWNSPHTTAHISKKVSSIPQKSAYQTPTRLNIQPQTHFKTKTKSKSKSKQKLMVLSAHKVRRIQSFKVEASPTSPMKGIHLISKQKKYGTQVRTINIF